jgi:hypothetical protein
MIVMKNNKCPIFAWLSIVSILLVLAPGCRQQQKEQANSQVSSICDVWTGYGKHGSSPTEVLLLDPTRQKYYLWIVGEEYLFQSYPCIGDYGVTADALKLRFPLSVEVVRKTGPKQLTLADANGDDITMCFRGTASVSDEELHFRLIPQEIARMPALSEAEDPAPESRPR